MKKFKYALSIKGTAAEFKNLLPKLEGLGYIWHCTAATREQPTGGYLKTNWLSMGDTHYLGIDHVDDSYRVKVPASNEKLVLALAAAVEGDVFERGELFVRTRDGVVSYDITAGIHGETSPWNSDYGVYRKATKEEIFNYYGGGGTVASSATTGVSQSATVTLSPSGAFPETWYIDKRELTPTQESKIQKFFDKRYSIKASYAPGFYLKPNPFNFYAMKGPDREGDVYYPEAPPGIPKISYAQFEGYYGSIPPLVSKHNFKVGNYVVEKGKTDPICRISKIREDGTVEFDGGLRNGVFYSGGGRAHVDEIELYPSLYNVAVDPYVDNSWVDSKGFAITLPKPSDSSWYDKASRDFYKDFMSAGVILHSSRQVGKTFLGTYLHGTAGGLGDPGSLGLSKHEQKPLSVVPKKKKSRITAI